MPQLPGEDGVADDDVLWQMHWQQTGTTLKADDQLQLKKVEYSPKEYGALKDALRKIELDLRKMPIYSASQAAQQAPAGPAPNDLDIIALNVDYQIADAHNWSETRTVEFKVLTYAGKKHFAELKVPFDPAWEDVKLDEGVVTSSSGEVHRVDPKEINVMDASAGTAPRYPVEKVLVVSFPSVEVGSTVRYRVTRTFKDRPFVAIHESFRGFDPIRRETVRVTAPPALAPR